MVGRKMGWATGLWIALGCCFALASPASAYFHLMQIEQIIAGVGGDSTAQAIQLRMRSALMGDVQNARLVVHDANGMNPIVVCDMSSPVANQFAGRRILIATDEFLNRTNPAPAVRDFAITALIPPSYFTAGSMTYESDGGAVQWRVCWGGAMYSGPVNLSVTNDLDGTCAPPEGASLPHTSDTALRFINAASALSTSSSADYALTTEAAIFINNAGTGYFVIGSEIVQACCKPDGSCEDLAPSSCKARGGTPQGAGALCSGTQCPEPTGACCLPDGSCMDGVREYDCFMSEGTFFVGQPCSAVNCLRGCCLPLGNCLNLPAEECDALGGTPLDLGITCCGAFCPELFPCCLGDGTCVMAPTSECENVFFGVSILEGAISCLDAVCLPNVACCFPDGLCTDYLDAEDCILDGGVPTAGVFCEFTDCPDPPIACCVPAGGCMAMTEIECIDAGGIIIGASCDGVTCLPTVACCFGDGTCMTTFGDGSCQQMGGEPGSAGSSCAFINCPQPVACCLADGSCMFVLAAECLLLQGTPQSAGTFCFLGLCPQPDEACCEPDGECTDLDPLECLDRGGAPQGVGSECFGQRGPGGQDCPPVGACCFSDGSCQDLTEDGCAFFGGVFHGESTECLGFDDCFAPGACCLPDGTCFFLLEVFCMDLGGIFQGEGASCAGPSDVCPPTQGACCLPGGACVLSDRESDCVAANGTFQGVGTSCSPNPCPGAPAGACCFSDGSCLNLPERDCDAQGGFWHGDFSFCTSARGGSDDERSGTPVTCPQPTVACCLPGGNCLDLPLPQCAQLGGTPGALGSACCDQLCPGPVTARCCMADGDCLVTDPIMCVAMGGMPGEPGSICDGFGCDRFACCYADGDCDFLFPEDCLSDGGEPIADCADCIGKKVQPLAGDYDGDDTVGLGDLGVIIQGWGSPYGLNDLGAVIEHWGMVRPPVQP